MITIAAPPRRAPQPREAREFSEWHEGCIEHLLRRSGLEVEREPQILGKTPDLLVNPPNGNPFIVECIARLQDPAHALDLAQNGWHVCEGNAKELHLNIFSRLEHKATKYRDIAEVLPYVISLYDASCMNSLDTALDLVMAPYAPTLTLSKDGKVTGKLYNTLWPTPNIPATLFELYPHLSGFIYSRWPREHYYLPNPYAHRPITPDLFQFAEIPELPESYQKASWEPRPATMADDYREPPEPWRPQGQHIVLELVAK